MKARELIKKLEEGLEFNEDFDVWIEDGEAYTRSIVASYDDAGDLNLSKGA